MDLVQLVDLLERGGPWTIAAIGMVTSAYLFKELRTSQRQSMMATQELNDRILLMTERLVAVTTVNNENQKQLITALRGLED